MATRCRGHFTVGRKPLGSANKADGAAFVCLTPFLFRRDHD
jgi:hypothetical protein